MSIFSINDSSSYGSIFSQTKANKENKTSSKTNFANTFIKQNASKLVEIQSNNSNTLASVEAMSNKNNIKNDSPNYDISSDFKNSIYTLKYKQVNNPVSMAYGYSVDAKGYMGSDFNKAAGLPEDFKIHKSTLDELYRVAENNPIIAGEKEYLGVNKYYENIDMADTIKQYYNLFSSALSQSFPNNKTSFTEADINSMPEGYAIDGFYSGYGGFQHSNTIRNNDISIKFLADYSDVKISNIYKTSEQFNEANNIYDDSWGLITGIKPETLGLSMKDLNNINKGGEHEFKPDMSVYPKNEDGSYPKEALFMSFLKSQEGRILYSPNTTLNPKVQMHNITRAKESFGSPSMHLDDIMTKKIDFKSLFEHYAEESFQNIHLYLYEHGISKNEAMGNSQLDFNMKKDFANGWKPQSSTINSYTNSIMDRLNNLISQTRA
ncbi:Cj0814 family flagellar-dependent secreted protein [Campylobacter volucris]|uniref:Cj0814 family flagellar-dependent secreted protein n=1 Tax=Campylobacter volucris TaxID=1031542 RepID=UPI001059E8B3|nr:hypothetical protein [Campylobacter volucris]TDJ80611.1 hypothetical protein E2O25_05125 [Campylobacter volucris]